MVDLKSLASIQLRIEDLNKGIREMIAEDFAGFSADIANNQKQIENLEYIASQFIK